MQLKLTPSRLESYRLFMTESWFSEEKLIKDISGEFEETPQILLGRAFHEWLETGIINPEYRFHIDEKVKYFGDVLSDAACIHEISSRRNMTLDGVDVLVSTRADAQLGNKLYEWKTTEKPLMMEKYADSCQWKFCLWAMELQVIEYRAVELKEKKGSWNVKAYDSTGDLFWSDTLLPGMTELMRGLIDFHFKHGLENKIICV